MYKEKVKILDILDLSKTISKKYLEKFIYPWEVIPKIKEIVIDLTQNLDKNEYIQKDEYIFIHKSAKIAPTACINGPCIIGANTEIRHCAFIRGSALIGENCVIGNSVEIKNAIIFDNAQIPHFNYVGDSILGYKAHMGAGSITSNVKSDKTLVNISKRLSQKIETGLKKFGAILGDYVEVGCNSVLNPGTIIGKNTNIYPTTCARGFYESNCIVKNCDNIIKKF